MDVVNIPGFATWKRAIENRLRTLEMGSGSDPWHVLGDPGEPTFGGSWTNYTPGGVGVTFFTGRFRRVGSNCQMEGLIQSVGGVNPVGSVICTLPLGYRPAKQVIRNAVGFGSVAGERAVRIDVTPLGNVTLNDSGFANPTTFLFLSLGLWFPLV